MIFESEEVVVLVARDAEEACHGRCCGEETLLVLVGVVVVIEVSDGAAATDAVGMIFIVIASSVLF